MPSYRVTATSLNMRSTPKVTGSNRITVLPQGQKVKKIDDTYNPWWLIHTSLLGDNLEGYVNSRFLVKDSEFDEPVKSNSITAIHLTENKTSITRNRDGGRAYPLGESNRPIRTATDIKDKIEQLKEIINWIKVDLSIRLKFVKKFHAAMLSSTATRELTTDLRGTGKSIPKLSSIAACATNLRTSEKAKWLRPLTTCRRLGVFSSRLA